MVADALDEVGKRPLRFVDAIGRPSPRIPPPCMLLLLLLLLLLVLLVPPSPLLLCARGTPHASIQTSGRSATSRAQTCWAMSPRRPISPEPAAHSSAPFTRGHPIALVAALKDTVAAAHMAPTTATSRASTLARRREPIASADDEPRPPPPPPPPPPCSRRATTSRRAATAAPESGASLLAASAAASTPSVRSTSSVYVFFFCRFSTPHASFDSFFTTGSTLSSCVRASSARSRDRISVISSALRSPTRRATATSACAGASVPSVASRPRALLQVLEEHGEESRSS